MLVVRRVPRVRRPGVTLVEALLSITMTAIAGSAILLSLGSSLQTTESTWQQAMAAGIAEQLLDEVAGARYAAAGTGPRQWPLGPGGHEGPHRASFDDLDDFHRFKSPIVDPWGKPLGQEDGQGGWRHPALRIQDGYLQGWRTEINVSYVSDDDLSTLLPAGQTSFHRAVRVRVFVDRADGSSRQVGEARRVFSYVPEL